MIGQVTRGIARGIRAHPGIFSLVLLIVVFLHILIPPFVLSLARKPFDYFSFNPWLRNLPSFLASSEIPFERKLEAVPKLALFWISSSNPYGVEWGFTVDVADLARFVFTSALIGAYFALVAYGRSAPSVAGGALGGVVSILGLSTGPCSVMGCGAPVMPVIGLALAGLSSTTLKLLHDLSTAGTIVVLIGLMASVGYRAYLVGASAAPRTA